MCPNVVFDSLVPSAEFSSTIFVPFLVEIGSLVVSLELQESCPFALLCVVWPLRDRF